MTPRDPEAHDPGAVPEGARETIAHVAREHPGTPARHRGTVPGKMIVEVGGDPVTVTVEREQLGDDLAVRGYPVGRSVYVITWNDH